MNDNNLWSQREQPSTLVLFDVDGTLTPARKTVSQEVIDALHKLKKKVVIGYVGGSDLNKQIEQLGDQTLQLFDYGFSENGLIAYRLGKPLPSQNFVHHLGNNKYVKLINAILLYIANLDIPIKRGTFIESRTGMLNVSPIGRNCSQSERDEFEQYDKVNQIRSTMVKHLQSQFNKNTGYDLTYSIGGQISFDVFPSGWDKTYCLRHLTDDQFDKIYFFGDKTSVGGNDYEIFTHPSVTGYSVGSPQDTLKYLNELFSV